MAFVVADRVQETCTSPGTGTVTLQGAATGYQAFSAGIGNGNVTFYAIADQGGSNWEVGIGTYTSSGNTLSRTTVLASSNGGSLTNFSSGIQNVWCDYPAGRAAMIDSNGKLFVAGQGYVDFASVSPAVAAGRMWYDGTTGSWNLGMGGGNITQQVGEELFVYGKASSAISDSPLQIIYQTGVVGASGVITFAPTTTGITNGDLILGVSTETIALNGFGRITCFGIVHGIATNGTAYGETWADGDVIWYNPTTGNPTKTKPSAPNIKVQIGTVISAGPGGSGSFFVEINHGSVLGGTDSNVQFGTLVTDDLMQYNGTYWTNKTVPAVFGTQTANTVFAGPSSGAAANPGFRALVAADMPASVDQFPSGTRLLFQQTAAPTGWTKVTTYNNYALRIVNGTVGTGGSVAFTTAFASQTPSGSVAVSGGSVSATTLTSAQIPGHTHNGSGNTGTVSADHTHNFFLSGNTNLVTNYPQGASSTNGCQTAGNTNGTQIIFSGSGTTNGANSNHTHSYSFTTDAGTPGGGSHTHGFTTPTASFTGNAINLAVQYVDSIIASKN